MSISYRYLKSIADQITVEQSMHNENILNITATIGEVTITGQADIDNKGIYEFHIKSESNEAAMRVLAGAKYRMERQFRDLTDNPQNDQKQINLEKYWDKVRRAMR